MDVPCSENYEALRVVDEGPTPSPVLASRTVKFNELFPIHFSFLRGLCGRRYILQLEVAVGRAGSIHLATRPLLHAQPQDQRMNHPRYIQTAENLLVVSREPLRQVDVEVRTPIRREARGERLQRASLRPELSVVLNRFRDQKSSALKPE